MQGSTALPSRVLRRTRLISTLSPSSRGGSCEHDYDIRLLLGDGDRIVIDKFRSVLHALTGSCDEDRIIEQPMASVQDLLAELAATDVIVATRFHNVLLRSSSTSL